MINKKNKFTLSKKKRIKSKREFLVEFQNMLLEQLYPQIKCCYERGDNCCLVSSEITLEMAQRARTMLHNNFVDFANDTIKNNIAEFINVLDFFISPVESKEGYKSYGCNIKFSNNNNEGFRDILKGVDSR